MFHMYSHFEMRFTSTVLILLPDKLWPLSDLNFGVKLALSVKDSFSVNLIQELHVVLSSSTFLIPGLRVVQIIRNNLNYCHIKSNQIYLI